MAVIPIKTVSGITKGQSGIHCSDRNIIESEIRNVQANNYSGDIIFSFNHGVLRPICKINQTKKIM